MAKVSVSINERAVVALVTRTTDELAYNAATAVQARARRFAPRRTGRLAESIKVTKVRGGQRTTYHVGSDLNYAQYQEFGTGPIYPSKRNGVLAWPATGMNNPFGTGMVFARSTKGVPATHFMKKAGAAITIWDFKPYKPVVR